MEGMEKQQRSVGRPNTYNYDMCVEICSEVANGFNIKTVLKSENKYPTFQTWCEWKRKHTQLADLYVKTMQDKAESEIEEIDAVYDMLKAKEIDPATANVLIQTKKWTASKFYPKMFGDKVQQEHSGEIKTSSIDISKLSTKTLEELANASTDEAD